MICLISGSPKIHASKNIIPPKSVNAPSYNSIRRKPLRKRKASNSGFSFRAAPLWWVWILTTTTRPSMQRCRWQKWTAIQLHSAHWHQAVVPSPWNMLNTNRFLPMSRTSSWRNTKKAGRKKNNRYFIPDIEKSRQNLTGFFSCFLTIIQSFGNHYLLCLAIFAA